MSKPYTRRTRSGIRFQWLNWDQSDPSGQFANSAVAWEDRADGESNPDWKSQIAANEGATTNFLAQLTTCTHVDGHLEFRGYVTALGDTPASFRMSGKRGALLATDYSSYTPVGGSSVNAAESQAASKFYNEASGIIAALQGGELLGETGKTAKSIVRKATEVAGTLVNWRKNWKKFLASPRRGNREASLKRAMAFASDNYLEWKFGVDPLVKDTIALANDLKDDFKEVETFEARGKGTEPGLASTSTPFSPLGGLVMAYANMVSTQDVSIQYKAAIVLRRYGVGGLAERLGLSPSNFLVTYYNLLPWSWLVDYFTNCGDIVSAIAFDPARIAWCNRTVRKNLKTVLLSGVNPEISGGLTAHAGYPIASPSRTEWRTKIVARSASMPSRIPELRFRTPDFQSEGGRTKWLNIAAVVTSQAFGNSALKSLGGSASPE